jgi:hypothetical protein
MPSFFSVHCAYVKIEKEKNWEVIDVTKSKVDRFKRTMPLVNDLHNSAMRGRHWEQIKVDILFAAFIHTGF